MALTPLEYLYNNVSSNTNKQDKVDEECNDRIIHKSTTRIQLHDNTTINHSSHTSLYKQCDSQLGTMYVVPTGHQRFVTDFVQSIMILHSNRIPTSELRSPLLNPGHVLVPTSELVTRLFHNTNKYNA